MGEGGSGRSEPLRELLTALDRFCQRPKTGRTPEELAMELIELRRLYDRVEVEFSEIAGQLRRHR